MNVLTLISTPSLADHLVTLMRRRGHVVHDAGCLHDALAIHAEMQPSVVLVEVTEPERDIEALRRLRQRLEPGRSRLLALVPDGEPDLVHATVEAGAHDVIDRLDDAIIGARLALAEQKRVAQELIDSEARVQAILDTTVDAIITIDAHGHIESFNKAAERLFGYQASEVIGQNVHVLMPSPYREAHDGYIEAYHTTGRRKIIGIGREIVAQRRDGSIFPIDLAVSEVRLGDRTIFTGIIRDLSVRKRLEREVIEVSAQEQQRIGQDLHDGLGSHLTGVALSCKALARRLDKGRSISKEEMEEIAHLVQEGVQQARMLSRGLNPVKVNDHGLETGLQELVVNTSQLTGLACMFEASEAIPQQTPEVTTHLYRIAQEALNNAVKHAGAENVWMRLSYDGHAITLTVRDDGKGLPEELNDREGIGHHVMQYRAHAIGASFSLENASGGGALVTCVVPLTPDHTVVAPELIR